MADPIFDDDAKTLEDQLQYDQEEPENYENQSDHQEPEEFD